MHKVGYRNLLIQYIEKQKPDQPILSTQITQYIADRTELNESDVKKAVNVNMSRLEKNGYVIRLEKGIYYRKIKTAFGYYTPNKESLFCKQLLYDNDAIIGYETGLSALNRIGLMSQMPNRKCIATNLYTKRVPVGVQVEIRKPTVNVNSLNYRYLQILDVIRDLDKAPIDAVRPAKLLQETAMMLGLDIDMLILMARKHYSYKTLSRTIDIMLEGTYEATQG